MTAKKFTPLTIGKKYPRRINNWAFLFQYKAIENAYLTPNTWRAWLKETDQAMRSQYSRIVLLVDKSAADADDMMLTNMPLSISPITQPMDQGIISTTGRWCSITLWNWRREDTVAIQHGQQRRWGN